MNDKGKFQDRLDEILRESLTQIIYFVQRPLSTLKPFTATELQMQLDEAKRHYNFDPQFNSLVDHCCDWLDNVINSIFKAECEGCQFDKLMAPKLPMADKVGQTNG